MQHRFFIGEYVDCCGRPSTRRYQCFGKHGRRQTGSGEGEVGMCYAWFMQRIGARDGDADCRVEGLLNLSQRGHCRRGEDTVMVY